MPFDALPTKRLRLMKEPQAVGTILLVEDETNLRRLSLEALQRQGYTVLEAEDGAAAMQLAAHYSGIIHLLLTDVVMPGMNGRELARRVTSIRPNVKVLYMSGYTETVIDRNGSIEPGVELLQKPFSMQELTVKIRELLGATIVPEAAAANLQPDESQISATSPKEIPMPSRAQSAGLIRSRAAPSSHSPWAS